MALTPWVTVKDITDHGLAIICSEQRRRHVTECAERARLWAGGAAEEVSLTIAKDLFGVHGPAYRFRIFFIPPVVDETGSQIQGAFERDFDPPGEASK